MSSTATHAHELELCSGCANVPEQGSGEVAKQPGPTAEQFRAIGTTVRILVTQPDTLAAATRTAQRYLADLDRCASRFRADSELSHLTDSAAKAPLAETVSPMMVDFLQASLQAAALTGGLVDPTVGSALQREGYDQDLDQIRALGPRRSAPARDVTTRRITWTDLALDIDAGTLRAPQGTVLDFGSIGKAHAADRIAGLLAAEHGAVAGAGFMVDLGGDIATSGAVPHDGWQVGVEDWRGQVRQVISLHGQAITTSSAMLRTWVMDREERHHIIDPRTGHSAKTPWAQVSVSAATAMEANAASTAAVILGAEAPRWLCAHGLPARLDARPTEALSTACVVLPGWPAG